MIKSFIFISGFIAILDLFFSFRIKTRKYILNILLIFLIIFDGLRWQMGVDWGSYYSFFQDKNILTTSHNFPVGFEFYTWVAQQVTSSYSLYLFFTTLVCYYIIYKSVFKYTEYSTLATFYLISTLTWYSGNLKQMIAIMFVAYSIRYIFKRKLLKFIIINILGLYFHASIIVNFPIYFLYGLNYVTFVLLFFFIPIFFIALPYLINITDYLFEYFDINSTSKGRIRDFNLSEFFGLTFAFGFARKVFSALLLFLYLLLNFKVYNSLEQKKLFLLLFTFSLTIYTYIIGFSYIEHFNSRIDIYFLLLYGSILIGVLDNKKNFLLNRLVLFLIVSILVAIYFFRISDFVLFEPYSSIFYNFDYFRDHHSIYVDYWE